MIEYSCHSIVEIFEILKQMLDIISSLNHVIHRDIKPENFIIDSITKKVFLIDLGMAIYKENSRGTQLRCGSLIYGSIKQNLGNHQVSKDDDMISAIYVSLKMLLKLNGVNILPWEQQGLNPAFYSNKMVKCKSELS